MIGFLIQKGHGCWVEWRGVGLGVEHGVQGRARREQVWGGGAKIDWAGFRRAGDEKLGTMMTDTS